MKSLSLILLFSLIAIGQLNSQIYTPGGILQGSSGNSNIGIGTSNPQGRLDVDGLVKLGWNGPSYGIGISSTGVGGGSWARRYGFYKNSDISLFGGFGALGEENSLSFYWIGTDYNNFTAAFYPDGNVSIKTGYSGIPGIPSSGNIELGIQGAGIIMKDETNLNRYDLHFHGDRLRQWNGTTELTYVTTDNPTFSGVLTLGTRRPVTITDGVVNIQAENGGWDMAYGFKGSSGTNKGGFGATGGDDGLGCYYIGILGNQKVTITEQQGFVGIGTSSPQHKLDVKGTIRANEVIVNTPGADFVFETDYKLPELSEIEKYVRENKHLPDIRSAAEMQKDGMNMSEMQTKLLQKIEELTLYIIQQDQKILIQEKTNNQLKNDLNDLREQINKLKR